MPGEPVPPPGGPEAEAPPVGRRWSYLYLIVVAFLALQILLYWLFTRAFS